MLLFVDVDGDFADRFLLAGVGGFVVLGGLGLDADLVAEGGDNDRSEVEEILLCLGSEVGDRVDRALDDVSAFTHGIECQTLFRQALVGGDAIVNGGEEGGEFGFGEFNTHGSGPFCSF